MALTRFEFAHAIATRAMAESLQRVPTHQRFTYAHMVVYGRIVRDELEAIGASPDTRRALLVGMIEGLQSAPDRSGAMTPARRRQLAAGIAEAFGYRAVLVDERTVDLVPLEGA